MDPEGEGVQPWQVFTAMFVAFWAASAYFNHFLMTLVFCIAFGVFGELMTKFMYGEKLARNLEQQKEDLKILLEKVNDMDNKEDEYGIELDIDAEEHVTSIPEPVTVTNEEIVEDEEDEPPPLPTKDYEMGNIQTVEEDNNTCMNPLEMEIEDDATNLTIENIELELTDHAEVVDTNVNIDIVKNENENQNLENEIQNLENQNQNLLTISDDLAETEDQCRDMEEIKNELTNGTCTETLDNITNANLLPESSAIVNNGLAEETILNNNETEIEDVKDIVKTSDDENISIEADTDHQVGLSNDAVVEIQEVTCVESAIKENTEDCDISQIESKEEENGNVEHLETVGEVIEDLSVENSIVTQLENEMEPVVAACDEKKIDISGEEAAEVPGNPEIDIDLTDPAVEAAATKIQSAFKGFMKKKNTSGKL